LLIKPQGVTEHAPSAEKFFIKHVEIDACVGNDKCYEEFKGEEFGT
jgi:hypothetical protein